MLLGSKQMSISQPQGPIGDPIHPRPLLIISLFNECLEWNQLSYNYLNRFWALTLLIMHNHVLHHEYIL